MFSVLGPEAAIFRATGTVKARTGSGSSTTAPRNVYRCADGKYVAMSASIQSMAKRVFEVIGRAEMIEDPRFRTNSDRVRNRAVVDEIVGSWFALRKREEALAQMRAAGVTVGPVYDIDDAVEDAHFREREILVEVEDADLGSIPMHNIVPRLSRTPGVWRCAAPKLGEHTDAILADAGYDPEAIAALRRQGAAA
jgi:crotonobetainyl-CoA:carnitine CoA-transferase CaiB-like acyl-CoA transferase